MKSVVAVFAVAFTRLAWSADSPEFHKDIEPVLQAHCQICHRPGEIGPMPLLSYNDARPWAKAMKNAVLTKQMPPWQAQAGVQHYRNDRSLTQEQINMIAAWADAGAPEGNPKDAPAPRRFEQGWNIGKPDLVIEMPEAYKIPAKGTVEYTYIILPSNFKEDRWVQAFEVRPGNRSVMHHAVLYARMPGSKWLSEYPKGVPFVPEPRPGTKKRSSDGDRSAEGSLADEWLVGYVPGIQPYVSPEGSAYLVKAGADFVLQGHYTTNGSAAEDQTRIGFVFAKEAPKKRNFMMQVVNTDFVIPPGAADFKDSGSITLASDVQVLSASPHMHVRGKAMDLRAEYPTGEKEYLLKVPRYDFNWQLIYELDKPKLLPRGTKLFADATFDNSANNRANPDPTSEVHWGDQSWEEMLLGLVTVQIEPDADLDKLYEKPPRRTPVR